LISSVHITSAQGELDLKVVFERQQAQRQGAGTSLAHTYMRAHSKVMVSPSGDTVGNREGPNKKNTGRDRG
jgi:hypothetical protein